MIRTPRRSGGRRSRPYPSSQPASRPGQQAGNSPSSSSASATPSRGKGTKGLFQNGQWFCDCTPRRPAALLPTHKPGPNKGRWFYTCPESRKKQCDFFMWEDYAGAAAQGTTPNNRSTYRTSIGRRTTPEREGGPPSAQSILERGTAAVSFLESGSRPVQGRGQGQGPRGVAATQSAQPLRARPETRSARPSRSGPDVTQSARPSRIAQTQPARPATERPSARQRIFTASTQAQPSDDEDDFEPPTPTPATRTRRAAPEPANRRITQYFTRDGDAGPSGQAGEASLSGTTERAPSPDYSDDSFDSEMERAAIALADHTERESRRAEPKSLAGDVEVIRTGKPEDAAAAAIVEQQRTPETPSTRRLPRRRLLISSEAYQQAVGAADEPATANTAADETATTATCSLAPSALNVSFASATTAVASQEMAGQAEPFGPSLSQYTRKARRQDDTASQDGTVISYNTTQMTTPPPSQHKKRHGIIKTEDEDDDDDRMFFSVGDPMDVDGDVFGRARSSVGRQSRTPSVKQEEDPATYNPDDGYTDHPATAKVMQLLADQPVSDNVRQQIRNVLADELGRVEMDEPGVQYAPEPSFIRR